MIQEYLHSPPGCWEESEKAGLKLNIKETKIMASGPITSWHLDGEKVETVTDFIFFGSKISADSDYSHGIKRHLLLGRKAMTILDSVLKTETHFADKVLYNQSSDFSSSHAQMWELDHTEGCTEELMLSNCGVGEDSWESLELWRNETYQP